MQLWITSIWVTPSAWVAPAHEVSWFCYLWCTHSHVIYIAVVLLHWGTRWRSWLRHCATSRKVAGSIPDGVIGIFHWHNPSGRTMTLGSTQPLTQMSTRNISWGLRRPVRRADNLTTFMCRLSWNLEASTSWNPQGLSRPVMGLLYLFSTSSFLFILTLFQQRSMCLLLRQSQSCQRKKWHAVSNTNSKACVLHLLVILQHLWRRSHI